MDESLLAGIMVAITSYSRQEITQKESQWRSSKRTRMQNSRSRLLKNPAHRLRFFSKRLV
jgi:hypothetical protein